MNGLTIGHVAKQAEVHVETVRYYERRGILPEPARSPSGYRQYDTETVRLIRFIKRAQDLGFTLGEIKQLIELRRNSRRNRSAVSALATAKLSDIDKKILQLQAMRKALELLVDACACKDHKLDCPIIEALNDDEKGMIIKKEK
ncbi:MAG: MerR family transcriptional regulator [Acidobacteria bacterium]|nr:MerR family transcriptional regulator [Acidobacteriota bacterium]